MVKTLALVCPNVIAVIKVWPVIRKDLPIESFQGPNRHSQQQIVAMNPEFVVTLPTA